MSVHQSQVDGDSAVVVRSTVSPPPKGMYPHDDVDWSYCIQLPRVEFKPRPDVFTPQKNLIEFPISPPKMSLAARAYAGFVRELDAFVRSAAERQLLPDSPPDFVSCLKAHNAQKPAQPRKPTHSIWDSLHRRQKRQAMQNGGADKITRTIRKSNDRK